MAGNTTAERLAEMETTVRLSVARDDERHKELGDKIEAGFATVHNLLKDGSTRMGEIEVEHGRLWERVKWHSWLWAILIPALVFGAGWLLKRELARRFAAPVAAAEAPPDRVVSSD